MKKLVLLAAFVLLMVSAVQAEQPGSSIWDVYCNVDFAYDGNETLTLFNTPGGTGAPFSQAFLPDGTWVDATLRVQILDSAFQPIAHFPAEDMWLASLDDGLITCIAGSAADSNTDSEGWTVWAEPLNAGGYSTEPCRLYVNGQAPVNWLDLDLLFNSPDINGDGQVNVADIALFSSSYFGSYSFYADFHYDGVLNLLDISRLATGMGASCP